MDACLIVTWAPDDDGDSSDGGGVEAQHHVPVDIPVTGTPEEDKSAADGQRRRHAAADVDVCSRVAGPLVVGTLAAVFVGTYVWVVATSPTWTPALLLLPLVVIVMLLVFFYMMSVVSGLSDKHDDGTPRLVLDDDDAPRALLDRKDDDQAS